MHFMFSNFLYENSDIYVIMWKKWYINASHGR